MPNFYGWNADGQIFWTACRASAGIMTQNMSTQLPGPDALAIIDEAGLTAKVRNLTPDHDGQIGLVAALMLPTPDLAYWEKVFKPPYDHFVAAAPPGAKLHITDAFRASNPAWAAAAEQSRRDIYALAREHRLRVTYLAREASVSRRSHERLEELAAQARSNKPSHISVPDRPSDTRLVTECYEGLISTIDVMAESFGCQHVALYADEIDEGVLKAMEADADELRHLSRRVVELPGYDKQQKQPLKRSIVFSSDMPGLDVTRVGTITMLGKSSSVVFAIDVIANALLHHLGKHPVGTSLNIRKSVEGWELEDVVFAPTDERHDIYSKL